MRRLLLAGVVATVAALATACGSVGFSGLYNVPLPGGADLGPHPYTITAQFEDVLDLVPQASVKVNDVAVGRVSSINLPNNAWTANVTMEINGSVRLPANAIASLEQTSLLGEKFIQLAAPTDEAPEGSLHNGSFIPLTRTNRNPQVEEVLGALSELLNGGGIGQIQTISKQLNLALGGNEPQARAALASINNILANLDAHQGDITAALDGLNRLAATLQSQDGEIGNLLDNLTPGLKVLDQQRDQLVNMLNALNTLSGVAVQTVNASETDLVQDLKSLGPTVQELASAGNALPNALQVLPTYPFSDAVLPAIKGDYLNVYLSVTAPSGTQILPPIAGPGGGA